MSDYEINKRLAELLGLRSIHDRAGMVCYQTEGGGSKCVDYCNNPSDIIPLVIEHKVHTAFNGKSWYAESWSNGYSRGESENYYKAAALCLIKTLDSERLTDKVNE